MDQLSRYRPSTSLRSLQSEVNRLFEDIFPAREGNGERALGSATLGSAAWSPKIDVLEAEGSYRLRVDLPGVQREDVQIKAEGRQLTIRGERTAEKQQKEENMLRTERAHGTFYRSMTLPAEVNPDKAKAKFENGVLFVDLPKVKKNQAKAITIS